MTTTLIPTPSISITHEIDSQFTTLFKAGFSGRVELTLENDQNTIKQYDGDSLLSAIALTDNQLEILRDYLNKNHTPSVAGIPFDCLIVPEYLDSSETKSYGSVEMQFCDDMHEITQYNFDNGERLTGHITMTDDQLTRLQNLLNQN